MRLIARVQTAQLSTAWVRGGKLTHGVGKKRKRTLGVASGKGNGCRPHPACSLRDMKCRASQR
jgi:hypothetical protein